MLRNKTAVVTGSTSGIGLGVARALAAQGANIVLNGFGDPQETEALRAAMASEFGVKVLYNGADMSVAAQVRALIAATVAGMGAIDILVNNAGIQHTAPIVNIASVHGLVASTMKSAYVAAKHGVIGLTKAVALETAGSGVTCNAVCPGWVLTPLVQKQIDALAERDGLEPAEAQAQLLSAKQPSGEFATPEQLGALVVFLCSDAARQISGASMTVDGGWTAQ